MMKTANIARIVQHIILYSNNIYALISDHPRRARLCIYILCAQRCETSIARGMVDRAERARACDDGCACAHCSSTFVKLWRACVVLLRCQAVGHMTRLFALIVPTHTQREEKMGDTKTRGGNAMTHTHTNVQTEGGSVSCTTPRQREPRATDRVKYILREKNFNGAEYASVCNYTCVCSQLLFRAKATSVNANTYTRTPLHTLTGVYNLTIKT